jgi:hypothetical protein
MDIIDKRYKRGKIYKIVCNETGEIYYGSTIKSIHSRIKCHICKKKCVSKQIINRNNYYYELVEDYSCNNIYELETRERWYIENYDCINKQIPTRTRQEWYENNRDRLLEQRKSYYQQNQEKILEKTTCNICGRLIQKRTLKQHQLTKICLAKSTYY